MIKLTDKWVQIFETSSNKLNITQFMNIMENLSYDKLSSRLVKFDEPDILKYIILFDHTNRSYVIMYHYIESISDNQYMLDIIFTWIVKSSIEQDNNIFTVYVNNYKAYEYNSFESIYYVDHSFIGNYIYLGDSLGYVIPLKLKQKNFENSISNGSSKSKILNALYNETQYLFEGEYENFIEFCGFNVKLVKQVKIKSKNEKNLKRIYCFNKLKMFNPHFKCIDEYAYISFEDDYYKVISMKWDYNMLEDTYKIKLDLSKYSIVDDRVMKLDMYSSIKSPFLIFEVTTTKYVCLLIPYGYKRGSIVDEHELIFKEPLFYL